MPFAVGVRLLGYGTVGAVVTDRSLREHDTLGSHVCGLNDLRAIAVRDARKERLSTLDTDFFARDAVSIVDHPDDVLIECVGGTSAFPSRRLPRMLARTPSGASGQRSRRTPTR